MDPLGTWCLPREVPRPDPTPFPLPPPFWEGAMGRRSMAALELMMALEWRLIVVHRSREEGEGRNGYRSMDRARMQSIASERRVSA